jgi:hypothetical protein
MFRPQYNHIICPLPGQAIGMGGRDAVMRLDRSTKLDRYEVLAPLGAGGLCEIYNARDTRVNRSVTESARGSSLPKWDRAPAHDSLMSLLNLFVELKRRVPVEGTRTEYGTLTAN